MSIFNFLIFLIESSLFVVSQEPKQHCSDLVKQLAEISTEFSTPEGNWIVYKTNFEPMACMIFTFNSTEYSGYRVADAALISRNSPLKIEFVEIILSTDKNRYVAISKYDGSVTHFHRLHPNVSTTTTHHWCSFSCEADGVYVETLACVVDKEENILEVDIDIESSNLPFRPDIRWFNSIEHCPDLKKTET